MATLATQSITRAGLDNAYTAAAGGGDKFTPNDSTFLHVKNGGGSSITVTIETPATLEGEAVTDRAVVVPNADERMIGPFPGGVFADPTDTGLCQISYSGVTSVTIGAFELS